MSNFKTEESAQKRREGVREQKRQGYEDESKKQTDLREALIKRKGREIEKEGDKKREGVKGRKRNYEKVERGRRRCNPNFSP